MKKLAIILLIFLMVLPAFAAAPARKRPRKRTRPNPAAVARAAILEADRHFAHTGATKNLEAFMDYVAQDVRFYNGGVMHTGKIPFRENWAAGFTDPHWRITWAPLYAEAADSGDLGYTTGSFEVHAQGQDGSPVVRKGSYVTIWRKQPDGSWKVALDIGNFAPPEKAVASGQ